MSNKLINLPHILWINLEKDNFRKNKMETLFSKYDLQNTRITGILGTQCLNYCNLDKKIESHERMSELGCFLSHIRAIEHFVTTPSIGEYCLICEDDLSFEYLPFWKKNFWDYIKKAPNSFNIIQLSVTYSILSPSFQLVYPQEHTITKHKWYMYCSGCYLIKRKAAEKLLKYLPKTNNKYDLNSIKHPISDVFIYQTIANVYSLPLFTYNTLLPSTIHENHIKNVHIPSKNFITNIWKNSHLSFGNKL